MIEQADLERKFVDLASQWRKETSQMSIMSDVVSHSAYQQIIEMGFDVVPLILRELEKKSDHWFWALKCITGENPVIPEDKGKIKK